MQNEKAKLLVEIRTGKKDLSDADLSGADLSDANLSRADLSRTEFDGLTVNQWIRLHKIHKKGTKLLVYKGVENNLTSSVIGNKQYELGKKATEKLCSFNVDEECKNGLHVCPTPGMAKSYGDKIIECEVDMGDIVAIPGQGVKVRVKRLKPLRIMPTN